MARKRTARPKAVRKKPAPPPAADVLTYRQRLFVTHYLGDANGNATEAARMAGYSVPKQQGTENLAKPAIRAEIDAKLTGAAMAADEVLARLSDVAAGDFSPFLTFGPTGEPGIDLKKLVAAGLGHLVKAVKHTKFGTNVEFHDPMAALEKLGRYHGLFADRVELSGPNGGPVPVDVTQAADKVYGERERT